MPRVYTIKKTYVCLLTGQRCDDGDSGTPPCAICSVHRGWKNSGKTIGEWVDSESQEGET